MLPISTLNLFNEWWRDVILPPKLSLTSLCQPFFELSRIYFYRQPRRYIYFFISNDPIKLRHKLRKWHFQKLFVNFWLLKKFRDHKVLLKMTILEWFRGRSNFFCSSNSKETYFNFGNFLIFAFFQDTFIFFSSD